MTIEVLVIYSDGTQALELQEVPDNWFEKTSEEKN